MTRKRLYYETMEEVLGNTNKVLVDTKAGGGNMIYLPLDKLAEGRARTLTLDEQRQVPATAPPREATPADATAVGTVESRRDRGTR